MRRIIQFCVFWQFQQLYIIYTCMHRHNFGTLNSVGSSGLGVRVIIIVIRRNVMPTPNTQRENQNLNNAVPSGYAILSILLRTVRMKIVTQYHHTSHQCTFAITHALYCLCTFRFSCKRRDSRLKKCNKLIQV